MDVANKDIPPVYSSIKTYERGTTSCLKYQLKPKNCIRNHTEKLKSSPSKKHVDILVTPGCRLK